MSDPKAESKRGRFGDFGGQYVAETLMPAVDELATAYAEVGRDAEFQRDLDRLPHRSASGRR